MSLSNPKRASMISAFSAPSYYPLSFASQQQVIRYVRCWQWVIIRTQQMTQCVHTQQPQSSIPGVSSRFLKCQRPSAGASLASTNAPVTS
jgi:hypothetical protein